VRIFGRQPIRPALCFNVCEAVAHAWAFGLGINTGGRTLHQRLSIGLDAKGDDPGSEAGAGPLRQPHISQGGAVEIM
jgi:hypothetical protein